MLRDGVMWKRKKSRMSFNLTNSHLLRCENLREKHLAVREVDKIY